MLMIEATDAIMTPLFFGAVIDRFIDTPEMGLGVAGLLTAFYVWRGMNLASTAATIAGAGVTYGVVLLVMGSIATMFGWIDPNPSIALTHAQSAFEVVADYVVDLLRMLWGVVA